MTLGKLPEEVQTGQLEEKSVNWKKQNYFYYDTLKLQKSISLKYWEINYYLLSEQININNYLSNI